MKCGFWHLAAAMILSAALAACGPQAAQPEDGAGLDTKPEVLEEPLVPEADGGSEEAAEDPAPAETPVPAEDAIEAQNPWLGTWRSDNGESLVVTAVSDEGISVTYNGWTASGDSLFHSDYEMAFQDAEHLVASAPTGQSWDYVLHLEGDQIRMESRYPDRFFFREGEVSPHEPFYGIWCFASKDEQEAQQVADNYRQQGIDAQVFLTTDWSNLNSEPWYVVSAGTYRTEGEADQALAAVQSVQPDAYIKHSGDWQG